VHALDPAAGRALPSILLVAQELRDAIALDMSEVLYRAHVVLAAVPTIEGGESFAGKLGAFEAVVHALRGERIAVLFEERATFLLCSAAPARMFSPSSVNRVPEKRDADATVHAAWRNEFGD
jgi:hypothetical protein